MATITENLEKLSASISSAYDSIKDKGGTLPSEFRAANLSEAIKSIPTGSNSIIHGDGLTYKDGKIDKVIIDYYNSIVNGTQENQTSLKNDMTDIFNKTSSFISAVNLSDDNISSKIQIKLNLNEMETARALQLNTVDFKDCIIEANLPNFGKNHSVQSYELVNTFDGYPNLTSFCLSSLSVVNYNGMPATFSNCSSLIKADYESLVYIENYRPMCQTHINNTSLISANFPSLLTIEYGGLAECFQNCTSLKTVKYPKLSSNTNGGFDLTHQNNISLIDVDLKNLIVSNTFNQMFYNCSSLISLDLGNLTDCIDGFHQTNTRIGTYGTFENCTSLNFVDLHSLSSTLKANYFMNTFKECINFKSLSLDSVTDIEAGLSANQAVFYGNNYLEEIYLPSLSSVTNDYMFDLETNLKLTTLHLGKQNENLLTACSGYSTKWGLSSLEIKFDL